MSSFRVGQTVRVTGKHWLRAQSLGIIVEHDPTRRSAHAWRVKFEPEVAGKGFTVEESPGQFLWLEEAQMEIVEDEKGEE